eukprot:1142409-Pelagomonas_calceolata.AAC.6
MFALHVERGMPNSSLTIEKGTDNPLYRLYSNAGRLPSSHHVASFRWLHLLKPQSFHKGSTPCGMM